MKIKDVITFLEHWAPTGYQESYDNSGLLVGNDNLKLTKALVCLDSTEEVINEAVRRKCNLVIAHHPINFKGLKRLTGRTYSERAVIKAIKKDVAIYSIHTNLDNVINGVNGRIADRLGIEDREVLIPKKEVLLKLEVYVPETHLETVRNAIFQAGAGSIGSYSECSFQLSGTGTYKPMANSNPFIGSVGKRSEEPEIKLELTLPTPSKNRVISAMQKAHPYEAVAYQLIELENTRTDIGAGIIGELPKSMHREAFLKKVKKDMGLKHLRYTKCRKKNVKRIAVMGGSGAFGIRTALRKNADAFVTADIKYHDFFDGENQMMIVDLGHFESEQYTSHLLIDRLKEKFPNFAFLFSKVNTNPVNYL